MASDPSSSFGIASLLVASIVSCAKPHAGSNLKLQNGSIDSIHAAVIPIIHGDAYCTGVALSTTLVLTAQHCVDIRQGDCGVTVTGQTPSACFYDSEYIKGDYTEQNAHHDIVALSFEAHNQVIIDRADSTPFPIFGSQGNPRRIPVHSKLTLVGFGSTLSTHTVGSGPIASGHGVGVDGEIVHLGARRSCTNRMKSFDVDPDFPATGIVALADNSNGTGCLPLPGDSGGPLLTQSPGDQAPTIVALASTVFYPQIGEQRAVYVGIYGSNSLDVIQGAAIWLNNKLTNSSRPQREGSTARQAPQY